MTDEITALIVDDHEVVREGLRLSLSRAPHIRVVGEAADGASAVEMAERRKPDVVIMDLRLPDADGAEAVRTLRAQPRTSGIPVVAMSALPINLFEGWLSDAGFAGSIVKPIDIDEFSALVRQFIASTDA